MKKGAIVSPSGARLSFLILLMMMLFATGLTAAAQTIYLPTKVSGKMHLYTGNGTPENDTYTWIDYGSGTITRNKNGLTTSEECVGIVGKLTYKYKKEKGRLKEVREYNDGKFVCKTLYKYDSQGRLSMAERFGKNNERWGRNVYTYNNGKVSQMLIYYKNVSSPDYADVRTFFWNGDKLEKTVTKSKKGWESTQLFYYEGNRLKKRTEKNITKNDVREQTYYFNDKGYATKIVAYYTNKKTNKRVLDEKYTFKYEYYKNIYVKKVTMYYFDKLETKCTFSGFKKYNIDLSPELPLSYYYLHWILGHQSYHTADEHLYKYFGGGI